ncbi:tyrosine-type recombinase/integrase [Nonomuraea jiangxiensis]|uniref:Core-binding (CB) domain-containing protein n=1 Tax=Nonomuraea jiangxiensis TaxID=633440 RepID=A0A1G9HL93_9ACTN|nr:hypothetical protein [Nonomuraea jiangxiensis]SDL13652.1 hypothetical protein SAMN05421869_122142 [Nonomuraea jiangxiensis]
MTARKPNGRSSIFLGKDGLWHGWVTVGIKPDGSPDRRHRKGKTEAEVTRKVRELESQRESGRVNKAGRAPTVAEWMAEFLDVICARLVLSEKMAPRTLTDYRSKTRNWIVPLLGKHRLDRLTPEHLDTAYTTMLEEGLSSSSVLKVHRILSRALTIAVRRGRITRNVATLIDAPSTTTTEIEPLTGEEARQILAVAKTKRNGARWSVALALGIRQGEALGLRWSYIDLATGEIKAWVPDPAVGVRAWLQRSTRLWREVAPEGMQEELQGSPARPRLQAGLQEALPPLREAPLPQGLHQSCRQVLKADRRRSRLPATQGQEQAHPPVPSGAPGPSTSPQEAPDRRTAYGRG